MYLLFILWKSVEHNQPFFDSVNLPPSQAEKSVGIRRLLIFFVPVLDENILQYILIIFWWGLYYDIPDFSNIADRLPVIVTDIPSAGRGGGGVLGHNISLPETLLVGHILTYLWQNVYCRNLLQGGAPLTVHNDLTWPLFKKHRPIPPPMSSSRIKAYF